MTATATAAPTMIQTVLSKKENRKLIFTSKKKQDFQSYSAMMEQTTTTMISLILSIQIAPLLLM